MMKRIRGQMLTGDGCGKLKDALVPKPKYDHKGDSEAELEYADSTYPFMHRALFKTLTHFRYG